MTFDQFITKYNGKYIDYDGMYNAQCVDLMRAYVKEVLGWDPYIAIPTRGYAKDIFKNFTENRYFKKVLNTPTNAPKKGDIIFFKTSLWFPFLYGIAGHVAIVSDGGLMKLISFDQNYNPTGSFSKFVNHTYKDCLGWLSPKK